MPSYDRGDIRCCCVALCNSPVVKMCGCVSVWHLFYNVLLTLPLSFLIGVTCCLVYGRVFVDLLVAIILTFVFTGKEAGGTTNRSKK